jgi:hypothetical protein
VSTKPGPNVGGSHQKQPRAKIVRHKDDRRPSVGQSRDCGGSVAEAA